ncbi:hypothetical protein G7Y89_g10256 [Cudoniella acicularis]|uniref:2EXR domain-containing protein n=1 Tax=Cudoniella acicularis TaxID=354080 RepID=A0A8H4W151_9HELO|nr:hypothetical protein G7Y89_g10256 [Cudoniella acicularis]
MDFAAPRESLLRNCLEFAHFPLLPTEIRLKIWKIASQSPRTLELLYRHTGRELRCLQAPPAILHVCRESRELGLQVYHLCFGSAKRGFLPHIYFNPANDIVYFGSRQYDDEILYINDYFRNMSGEICIPERDHIQYLAISEPLWKDQRCPFTYVLNIPRMQEALSRLKELIFVKNPPSYIPGGSETEERFNSHAGISLVRSEAELPVGQYPMLKNMTQFFIRKQSEEPENTFPKFTVMEYGLHESQGSQGSQDSVVKKSSKGYTRAGLIHGAPSWA